MSRKRWFGLTKDDSVYLEHILDEIAFLTSHVECLRFEDLMEDELLQRGVIRSLEIIGEASKNVSPGLKEAYPQIPWNEMAATRDKLIYAYHLIEFEIVWRTLNEDTSLLKSFMRRILDDIERESPKP